MGTVKFKLFMTKNRLFFFVSTLLLIACNQKEKEKDKYEIEKEQKVKLDSLNETDAERIININKAKTDWYKSDLYTYQIQEMINPEQPLSLKGYLHDILKKDSVYILKIQSSYTNVSSDFIADISVDSTWFQDMRKKFKSKDFTEGCFIIKINKIQSSFLSLSSEIEGSTEEEDLRSDLIYEFNGNLIHIYGNLIDYYIYKTL